MQLHNPQLLKTQAYINGQWCQSTSGKTFVVGNPATQQTIAQVVDADEEMTQEAIKKANLAFYSWKKTSAAHRANLLRKWYELMIENVDDLALILTKEQGKPLAEAKGEIRYGASFIEWFAEEAKRTYGDTIPGHGVNKRIVTIKQPIGVTAAITPWNFPNAMITRKAAAALAAGCTMIVKPSELTPLSALAMAYLAEEAGIPPGVFSVLPTTDAPRIGQIITSHPLVKKISFTGSTAVGKLLLQQSAATVKKVSMELGGNAPFIVFNDANIDDAVQGAIASKYRNAGQTCVCANRIYLQQGIKEEFIAKFTKAVAEQKVGEGIKANVVIGPLINQSAFDKVSHLVNNAIEKGANLHLGGHQHELGGTFFEPTILSDITPNMDIAHEEIFGPIAPIFTFKTEEEVVTMANNTPFGLAAYFYGRDISQVWRVAEALEYGMVGINTGMISTAVAPFGGVKESGFGREGSKYGIEEYLQLKYLCFEV